MKNFVFNVWNKFRDIFGLHRNSKYVKNYLNHANMRSGIFMSAIIVILEIWLVIRQTNKYVIDAIKGGTPFFQAVFTNLWTYFLLLSLGVAMMVYCIQYVSGKKSKSQLIIMNTIFIKLILILI